MPEAQSAPRWEELVPLGRVARAQGRRGEVVLDALAEAAALSSVRRVHLESRYEGVCQSFNLDGVRIHKGRPVLSLAGIDDISAAEALAGVELRVDADELGDLPGERYLQYQLINLEVWDLGKGYIGVVQDVVSTGGSDILVVRPVEDFAETKEAAVEVLIPFCAEICPTVDLERQRIQTRLPEGLVELNAR